MFTMKCYFETNPAKMFFTIFVTTVLVMSYLMRIFELPYSILSKLDINEDIAYFPNSVWLVIMTVTTVGYGDVIPHTGAGKTIAVVAALWGSLLVSLLVVTQMSFFELELGQKKALRHINLSKSAANTINISAKYFLAKKKLYILKLKYNSKTIEKSNFL